MKRKPSLEGLLRHLRTFDLLRTLRGTPARWIFIALVTVFFCLSVGRPARAQQSVEEAKYDSAPIEIDGVVLFRVRGFAARPAEQRAASIVANIEELASNPLFRPEQLRAEERDLLTEIAGGDVVIMRVSDDDARLEGVQRPLMAKALVDRIGRAIVEYRRERTRASLFAAALRVVIAIVIAAALVALSLWILRRVEFRLHDAFERRSRALTAESRNILRVEGFWRTLKGAINLSRFALVLLAGLFLLQYVLVQFPWTRSAGVELFAHVSGALANVGLGIVDAVPGIVFLAILFFATRYVLSLARLYFDALQRGSVKLRGFEPEWSTPTHNLVRIGLVASAMVIAYPYIPGSGSDAFKGISILVGVLLSLGSSSAVSNIVAGYMIVFRRGFRVGDRVDIGDVHGIVTEMRLQVTHVRTIKNEEVTIPNSLILGSMVMNYSNPARAGKLILHTEVGIGYEVSWRQVEAMLLEAADRTPRLLKQPRPFVVQLKLADFAITYQINACTEHADEMQRTYSELHSNILDVFNENGVQIMTPAYEGDPETPKVVARENMFLVPAKAVPAKTGTQGTSGTGGS
jgi:small-conductance mechanosensitive channel